MIPTPERVTHVLLTKYNTRFAGDVSVHPRGLDPAWLDGRLELFTQAPLRSVRQQTAPPAAWLVFIDADTPRAQRAALQSAVGAAATLVEVVGQLTDDVVSTLVAAEVRVPAGQTLITTRLDSDDALSVDHLARVQDLARSYRGFINPSTGVQLARGSVLLRHDRSSAFLSLVEDVLASTRPRTVFCVEHHDAHRAGPVRQLRGVAWVQTIHGGNVANQAEGVPYPRRRAERLLGYSLPERQASALSVAQASAGVLRHLTREARELVRRMVA